MSAQTGTWAVDPVTQVELWVPDFATPESAVLRAALKRDGLLQVIRFFPEISNGWLLWTKEGGESPEDYGLSEPLCRALQELNDAWQEERLWEREWSSSAAEESWKRKADEAANWLQRELWDVAEVVPQHRRSFRSEKLSVWPPIAPWSAE